MLKEEIDAMEKTMREAWKQAATGCPVISYLFEDDAPYLTMWDDNRCKCKHGRILKNVYDVQGQQRTAQAFLCTMPGECDEEGIDVVNVHAPSGTLKLTDAQRFQLIQNLLQSSSMTRADRPIGEGRFLIGGDMNTDEIPLGQILDKLKIQGILKTNVEVMVPLNGKHGDICVVGGFTTTMVQERARNHDPQHVPYGIAWRKQPQHATEQLTTTPPPQTQIPTAPDTTTESSATEATAAAVPTGRTPKQTQPDPQVVAVPPETQLSQLPLEKASASAWPATEQPHPDEHEAPDLNGPGQQMAYVIVNAFLDNVTFESTEAETLIKRVILKTGEVIRSNMLLNIDEVFRPIFFHYPNGLNDKTHAEPRNASKYIKQWRDIAKWRHSGDIAAAPWYTTVQLAKHQVQSILHQYIDNFIRNEADEIQRAQPWNKNKSRAEAVLRKRCGSTMMAKLIWELGLPNVSSARFAVVDKSLSATEQPRPLPEDVRESMARDTETILNWLSVLATSIHEHKATDKYQEHARKSGTQKHKSGLNEAELKVKEDKKRDARQKYGRQPSTASCSHTWPAPAEWVWVPAQWQRRGDTWQAFAQWQGHGDTWPAPAQWTWHGNKWEALAK